MKDGENNNNNNNNNNDRVTYYDGYGSLDELDEETLLKNSKFPIKPDELIALTKRFLSDCFFAPEPHLKCAPILSEDFEYWSFIVGPINKKTYLDYVRVLRLPEAFPDYKTNSWGYRVDPLELNRVWINTRWTGTHTKTLMGKIKPTYKYLEFPPATVSLTFTEEGLVSKYTTFVSDRSVGNTHGYAGIFGVFRALGENVPFPDVVENYLRKGKDTHKRKGPGLYFKIRAWFWQRKVTKRANRRSKNNKEDK